MTYLDYTIGLCAICIASGCWCFIGDLLRSRRFNRLFRIDRPPNADSTRGSIRDFHRSHTP